MVNQAQGHGILAPLRYARELQKIDFLATSLSKGTVTLNALDMCLVADKPLDLILLNGFKRVTR